jgi:hypothetical protein
MNSGMIAASAAIFGSLVGAGVDRRHLDHTTAPRYPRPASEDDSTPRIALSDFITESARLLVDAMVQNNSDPQKLIPLYALLSRIRLSSSATVLETA